MSFSQDQSTMMQGAGSNMFDTLLGGMSKTGTDGTSIAPVGETQGKKPKAKSPTATFLGGDATTPRGSMGVTMLGSS